MTFGKRIKNTPETHTPSVDAIAGNEDLLVEILLHLPPKSLLRFQCVSKHWLSLISNPQFRRRHSHRNPNSVATALFYNKEIRILEFGFISLIALENQTNTIPFHFLDFLRKFTIVRYAHSCNGLLCVEVIVDGLMSHFVCNPTTNQSIELPQLVKPIPSHTVAFNLAFDPSKSHHYRVVCVLLTFTSQMYHFSTYKSETQLWRDSGESLTFRDNESCFFKKGVHWNGAIHWVSKSRHFLCFDADNECFKAMPSTPIPQGRRKRRIKYFGESGGHLHLIEIYGSRKTLFDVLEMERDYSKWFTKYRVDLDSPPPSTAFSLKKFSILSLLLEEKESKVRLVLSIPGVFLLYDLSGMTFKELSHSPAHIPQKMTLEIHPRWSTWCNISHYIETLSSV